MKFRVSTVLAAAGLAALAWLPALAQGVSEYAAGKLRIERPWSRATPRSAPVAAGYFKITNAGAEADRLTGVVSDISGHSTIHEMAMEAGVMKMRALANGLEIKPGASVELKPGGFHLMFEDLKAGLTEGQSFKAALIFEKAGRVEVDFAVMALGAAAPGAGQSHQH